MILDLTSPSLRLWDLQGDYHKDELCLEDAVGQNAAYFCRCQKYVFRFFLLKEGFHLGLLFKLHSMKVPCSIRWGRYLQVQ